MKFPNNTIAIASVICIAMVFVAGCTVDQGGGTRTTTIETTTAGTLVTERTIVTNGSTTPTLEGTETTTNQPSTTTKTTDNLPYELWVANYGEEKTEIIITIQADNGTAIYNDTVVLSSNSTEKLNLTFPRRGSYKIIAKTKTSYKTRSWNVKAKDPVGAASVVLTNDGKLYVDIKVI